MPALRSAEDNPRTAPKTWSESKRAPGEGEEAKDIDVAAGEGEALHEEGGDSETATTLQA